MRIIASALYVILRAMRLRDVAPVYARLYGSMLLCMPVSMPSSMDQELSMNLQHCYFVWYPSTFADQITHQNDVHSRESPDGLFPHLSGAKFLVEIHATSNHEMVMWNAFYIRYRL